MFSCRQLKYSQLLRVIALVLVITFSGTSVSFSAPEIFNSPQNLLSDHSAISKQDFQTLVPENLGRVSDYFLPEGCELSSAKCPAVFYLQDAHANSGAQQNIQKIARLISDKFNVRTILAEGASGEADLSQIRAYPNQKIKDLTTRFWLEQVILTGIESEAVLNPRPYQLLGVENQTLYDANNQEFLEALSVQKEILPVINLLTKQNNGAKERTYNKHLFEFEKKVSLYEQRGELISLVSYLANLGRDGGVKRSDLVQIEKLISLILLERSFSGAKDGEKVDEKKEFEKLSLEIGAVELFREFDLFKNRIREKLFTDEEEKILHTEGEHLKHLRALVILRATPEDFEYYRGHQKEILKFLEGRLDFDKVSRAAQFYVTSKKRDDAFLKNIKHVLRESSQKTGAASSHVILVTGGFHAEDLTERFRKENVPFVLISPQVSAETNFHRYYERMKGDSPNLEKFKSRFETFLKSSAIQPKLELFNPNFDFQKYFSLAEFITQTSKSELRVEPGHELIPIQTLEKRGQFTLLPESSLPAIIAVASAGFFGGSQIIHAYGKIATYYALIPADKSGLKVAIRGFLGGETIFSAERTLTSSPFLIGNFFALLVRQAVVAVEGHPTEPVIEVDRIAPEGPEFGDIKVLVPRQGLIKPAPSSLLEFIKKVSTKSKPELRTAGIGILIMQTAGEFLPLILSGLALTFGYFGYEQTLGVRSEYGKKRLLFTTHFFLTDKQKSNILNKIGQIDASIRKHHSWAWFSAGSILKAAIPKLSVSAESYEEFLSFLDLLEILTASKTFPADLNLWESVEWKEVEWLSLVRNLRRIQDSGHWFRINFIPQTYERAQNFRSISGFSLTLNRQVLQAVSSDKLTVKANLSKHSHSIQLQNDEHGIVVAPLEGLRPGEVEILDRLFGTQVAGKDYVLIREYTGDDERDLAVIAKMGWNRSGEGPRSRVIEYVAAEPFLGSSDQLKPLFKLAELFYQGEGSITWKRVAQNDPPQFEKILRKSGYVFGREYGEDIRIHFSYLPEKIIKTPAQGAMEARSELRKQFITEPLKKLLEFSKSPTLHWASFILRFVFSNEIKLVGQKNQARRVFKGTVMRFKLNDFKSAADSLRTYWDFDDDIPYKIKEEQNRFHQLMEGILTQISGGDREFRRQLSKIYREVMEAIEREKEYARPHFRTAIEKRKSKLEESQLKLLNEALAQLEEPKLADQAEFDKEIASFESTTGLVKASYKEKMKEFRELGKLDEEEGLRSVLIQIADLQKIVINLMGSEKLSAKNILIKYADPDNFKRLEKEGKSVPMLARVMEGYRKAAADQTTGNVGAGPREILNSIYYLIALLQHGETFNKSWHSNTQVKNQAKKQDQEFIKGWEKINQKASRRIMPTSLPEDFQLKRLMRELKQDASKLVREKYLYPDTAVQKSALKILNRLDKKIEQFKLTDMPKQKVKAVEHIRNMFEEMTYDLIELVSKKYAAQERFLKAENLIVAADDMSLTTLLKLYGTYKNLSAIVTRIGTPNEHWAIDASSEEILVITSPQKQKGSHGDFNDIKNGSTAYIDGEDGSFIANPSRKTTLRLEEKIINEETLNRLVNSRPKGPVYIKIGEHQVPIFIGGSADKKKHIESLSNSATSLELFRTEFGIPPDLDEELMDKDLIEKSLKQYITGLSEKLLEAAKHLPDGVTVRAVDKQKDKPLQGIISKEVGLEFYKTDIGEKILRAQLDAVIKARIRADKARSPGEPVGEIKVLFPMIRTREDVDWLLKIYDEVEDWILREEKIPAKNNGKRFTPIGFMIETKDAVKNILNPEKPEDQILDPSKMDFISFGTNDLTSELFDALRSSERYAHLFSDLQPPILNIIESVTKAAIEMGISVSVCGELGGYRRFSPFPVDVIRKYFETFVGTNTHFRLAAKAGVVGRLSYIIENATLEEIEELFRNNRADDGLNQIKYMIESATKREIEGLIESYRENNELNQAAISKIKEIEARIRTKPEFIAMKEVVRKERAAMKSELRQAGSSSHPFLKLRELRSKLLTNETIITIPHNQTFTLISEGGNVFDIANIKLLSVAGNVKRAMIEVKSNTIVGLRTKWYTAKDEREIQKRIAQSGSQDFKLTLEPGKENSIFLVRRQREGFLVLAEIEVLNTGVIEKRKDGRSAIRETQPKDSETDAEKLSRGSQVKIRMFNSVRLINAGHSIDFKILTKTVFHKIEREFILSTLRETLIGWVLGKSLFVLQALRRWLFKRTVFGRDLDALSNLLPGAAKSLMIRSITSANHRKLFTALLVYISSRKSAQDIVARAGDKIKEAVIKLTEQSLTNNILRMQIEIGFLPFLSLLYRDVQLASDELKDGQRFLESYIRALINLICIKYFNQHMSQAAAIFEEHQKDIGTDLDKIANELRRAGRHLDRVKRVSRVLFQNYEKQLGHDWGRLESRARRTAKSMPDSMRAKELNHFADYASEQQKLRFLEVTRERGRLAFDMNLEIAGFNVANRKPFSQAYAVLNRIINRESLEQITGGKSIESRVVAVATELTLYGIGRVGGRIHQDLLSALEMDKRENVFDVFNYQVMTPIDSRQRVIPGKKRGEEFDSATIQEFGKYSDGIGRALPGSNLYDASVLAEALTRIEDDFNNSNKKWDYDSRLSRVLNEYYSLFDPDIEKKLFHDDENISFGKLKLQNSDTRQSRLRPDYQKFHPFPKEDPRLAFLLIYWSGALKGHPILENLVRHLLEQDVLSKYMDANGDITWKSVEPLFEQDGWVRSLRGIPRRIFNDLAVILKLQKSVKRSFGGIIPNIRSGIDEKKSVLGVTPGIVTHDQHAPLESVEQAIGQITSSLSKELLIRSWPALSGLSGPVGEATTIGRGVFRIIDLMESADPKKARRVLDPGPIAKNYSPAQQRWFGEMMSQIMKNADDEMDELWKMHFDVVTKQEEKVGSYIHKQLKRNVEHQLNLEARKAMTHEELQVIDSAEGSEKDSPIDSKEEKRILEKYNRELFRIEELFKSIMRQMVEQFSTREGSQKPEEEKFPVPGVEKVMQTVGDIVPDIPFWVDIHLTVMNRRPNEKRAPIRLTVTDKANRLFGEGKIDKIDVFEEPLKIDYRRWITAPDKKTAPIDRIYGKNSFNHNFPAIFMNIAVYDDMDMEFKNHAYKFEQIDIHDFRAAVWGAFFMTFSEAFPPGDPHQIYDHLVKLKLHQIKVYYLKTVIETYLKRLTEIEKDQRLKLSIVESVVRHKQKQLEPLPGDQTEIPRSELRSEVIEQIDISVWKTALSRARSNIASLGRSRNVRHTYGSITQEFNSAFKEDWFSNLESLVLARLTPPIYVQSPDLEAVFKGLDELQKIEELVNESLQLIQQLLRGLTEGQHKDSYRDLIRIKKQFEQLLSDLSTGDQRYELYSWLLDIEEITSKTNLLIQDSGEDRAQRLKSLRDILKRIFKKESVSLIEGMLIEEPKEGEAVSMIQKSRSDRIQFGLKKIDTLIRAFTKTQFASDFRQIISNASAPAQLNEQLAAASHTSAFLGEFLASLEGPKLARSFNDLNQLKTDLDRATALMGTAEEREIFNAWLSEADDLTQRIPKILQNKHLNTSAKKLDVLLSLLNPQNKDSLLSGSKKEPVYRRLHQDFKSMPKESDILIQQERIDQFRRAMQNVADAVKQFLHDGQFEESALILKKKEEVKSRLKSIHETIATQVYKRWFEYYLERAKEKLDRVDHFLKQAEPVPADELIKAAKLDLEQAFENLDEVFSFQMSTTGSTVLQVEFRALATVEGHRLKLLKSMLDSSRSTHEFIESQTGLIDTAVVRSYVQSGALPVETQLTIRIDNFLIYGLNRRAVMYMHENIRRSSMQGMTKMQTAEVIRGFRFANNTQKTILRFMLLHHLTGNPELEDLFSQAIKSEDPEEISKLIELVYTDQKYTDVTIRATQVQEWLVEKLEAWQVEAMSEFANHAGADFQTLKNDSQPLEIDREIGKETRIQIEQEILNRDPHEPFEELPVDQGALKKYLAFSIRQYLLPDALMQDPDRLFKYEDGPNRGKMMAPIIIALILWEEIYTKLGDELQDVVWHPRLGTGIGGARMGEALQYIIDRGLLFVPPTNPAFHGPDVKSRHVLKDGLELAQFLYDPQSEEGREIEKILGPEKILFEQFFIRLGLLTQEEIDLVRRDALESEAKEKVPADTSADEFIQEDFESLMDPETDEENGLAAEEKPVESSARLRKPAGEEWPIYALPDHVVYSMFDQTWNHWHRVVQIMRARGIEKITTSDLFNQIQETYSHVQSVLSGSKKVRFEETMKVAEKLARALNVTPDLIFGIKRDPIAELDADPYPQDLVNRFLPAYAIRKLSVARSAPRMATASSRTAAGAQPIESEQPAELVSAHANTPADVQISQEPEPIAAVEPEKPVEFGSDEYKTQLMTRLRAQVILALPYKVRKALYYKKSALQKESTNLVGIRLAPKFVETTAKGGRPARKLVHNAHVLEDGWAAQKPDISGYLKILNTPEKTELLNELFIHLKDYVFLRNALEFNPQKLERLMDLKDRIGRLGEAEQIEFDNLQQARKDLAAFEESIQGVESAMAQIQVSAVEEIPERSELRAQSDELPELSILPPLYYKRQLSLLTSHLGIERPVFKTAAIPGTHPVKYQSNVTLARAGNQPIKSRTFQDESADVVKNSAAKIVYLELLRRYLLNRTRPIPFLQLNLEQFDSQLVALRPLGGAEEIGASSTLVRIGGKSIIIDAGTRFQQGRELPDFTNLKQPDAIFVTHAHLDHIGALPILHKLFPEVPIYATKPTYSLLPLVLKDSANVMKIRRREDKIDMTLFTNDDVDDLMKAVIPVDWNRWYRFGDNLKLKFTRAGHILGAASILFATDKGTFLAAGDFTVKDQRTVGGIDIDSEVPVDVLMTEGTYGKKTHPDRHEQERKLIEAVERTVSRNGSVLIPSFSLGRAQEVALILLAAIDNGDLKNVPIYFDGQVKEVSRLYNKYAGDLNIGIPGASGKKESAFETVKGAKVIFVDHDQRERIARSNQPSIIIASSGMLNGGPSVYYASKMLEKPENALFIVGYQDEESPGRQLLNLKQGGTIWLHVNGGERTAVKVNADVHPYYLSAHADGRDVAGLAAQLKPRRVVLVHGEHTPLMQLKDLIRSQLSPVSVGFPTRGELVQEPPVNDRKELFENLPADSLPALRARFAGRSTVHAEQPGRSELRKVNLPNKAAGRFDSHHLNTDEKIPGREQNVRRNIFMNQDSKGAILISIDMLKDKSVLDYVRNSIQTNPDSKIQFVILAPGIEGLQAAREIEQDIFKFPVFEQSSRMRLLSRDELGFGADEVSGFSRAVDQFKPKFNSGQSRELITEIAMIAPEHIIETLRGQKVLKLLKNSAAVPMAELLLGLGGGFNYAQLAGKKGFINPTAEMMSFILQNFYGAAYLGKSA